VTNYTSLTVRRGDRLLRRILRHNRIVSEALQFGRVSLAFTRIAEPDEVLDRVAKDESNPQRLPYWAELWESSAGIAQFLLDHEVVTSRATVLDLGCGMGLAGLMAARVGGDVLFADIESQALLFALLNCWRNGIIPRTRQLDWRTDQLDRRFDLILGADILYEREQWDHLERFWRAHLNQGGRVILGEPGRQTGEQFPTWVESHGWSLAHHQQPVPTRPVPINIFKLTL